MKKVYLFAILFIFCSSIIFAQQSNMRGSIVDWKLDSATFDELKFKSSSNTNKSYGDTLWYEDFSGGFSINGWTSYDFSQNGLGWIYSTTGPGGQYSSNVPAIASTTTANGFASLPSDAYNTPTPSTGFPPIRSSLTSGPIVITPKSSIILRWQQSQRYCCDQNTTLNLEVSNDSINWVAFDAKFGRGANTAVTENAEINISSVAANEDTIYIRFIQNLASHYYWMIDDIALVEGLRNNIRIDEVFSSFGSIKNEGFYTQVPQFQAQNMSFAASILNEGGFDATNVRLQVDVERTALSTTVYSDSSNFDSLASLATKFFDISNSSYQNIDGVGDYTIKYMAKSDSINQLPQTAYREIKYKISDTVFARDYDVPNGSVGANSFGSLDSTIIGTKYTLDTLFTLTSVSYFIADRAEVAGAVIKARVWKFDTTQTSLNAAFTQVVAENPIPYTITTADRGKWLTIPIIPTVILPAGQYVAAAEQIGGAFNGFELYIGRDRVSEELQPFGLQYCNFIFVNDASPSWGNIFAQPMIRMNVNLVEGIDEIDKTLVNFSVSPNPNNGQFKVSIVAPNAKFTLNVRNIMGQVVYTENVSVQNSLKKEINLSNLDKGIYFLSVENEISKEVKKVVIR